ncbi:MAG: hypothetical protein RL417_2451 [Pseudomonadota bacterium]|jgi:phospholipid N-methyltransferase
MLKDNLVFFRECIKEFEKTGTAWPTSKWAANALTDPLRDRWSSKRILEIGPGTGSVTVQILRDMLPEDRLMICEINPRFMATLKENLAANPDFLKHSDRIEFFEGPIQALPEHQDYDVVVCALPFLNFDLKTVKEIFAKLKTIAAPNAVMTYYQYIGLRSLSRTVSTPRTRQRMRELDTFFDSMYAKHLTCKKRVWLNLLPINIYTLDIAA